MLGLGDLADAAGADATYRFRLRESPNGALEIAGFNAIIADVSATAIASGHIFARRKVMPAGLKRHRTSITSFAAQAMESIHQQPSHPSFAQYLPIV